MSSADLCPVSVLEMPRLRLGQARPRSNSRRTRWASVSCSSSILATSWRARLRASFTSIRRGRGLSWSVRYP